MKNITWQELSGYYAEQLVKGVFLTVKEGESVNTMTVGWGNVGYIWNKPVLMVPVRYSRHTYSCAHRYEKSPRFLRVEVRP